MEAVEAVEVVEVEAGAEGVGEVVMMGGGHSAEEVWVPEGFLLVALVAPPWAERFRVVSS